MTLHLNITIAQLNPTVGALNHNFNKIREVRNNASDECDLIVYPELITTGYPTDDLVLSSYFINRLEANVEELIKESANGPALLISTPWKEEDELYNVTLLISEGKILHKTYKNHLPNYGVFDEKRVFEEGALPDVCELKGVKLGILVCEDMWFSDVSNHLKQQGAEILIVPNGSPYQTDIHVTRETHAKNRVKETGLPLIYINQVGGQDELVFDGASFALDEKGKITHQLPIFEEAVMDLNQKIMAPRFSLEATIYKALVVGLRDYVQKNNFPGVLIGLSGGIDSALSAAIAVDALGSNKVQCVMMPSPYTSQESLDDAKECAKLLNMKLDSISIEPAMTAYDQMFADYVDAENSGTTFENIQSRARGMTLMALSNASGKMVLSTGNKSEMAVGYATLYGDMCGGFNAIKDLYKGQVYALSNWRNAQGLVIPENIIQKAPSAELKPDQTDQDSLPPYDILDDILENLIEKNTPPHEIKQDQDIVMKIWKLLDATEYKRKQAPPGVKITSKSFGRNRRYPITNGFFKNQ